MLYPDKLTKIQDECWLYIPAPDLVKATYESLLARDPATPFPFWAQRWPSSKAMASFLTTETNWIEGKQVLEIGAGIGLPSFIIANLTKGMIISDHARDAVELLEKNIAHLKLQHVKAMCLDWNNFPDDIKADTLLLSDINYEPGQFGPLLALVQRFLAEGTIIILSTPQRLTANPFVTELAPYIKQSVLKTVAHMEKLVEIRLLVLSI